MEDRKRRATSDGTDLLLRVRHRRLGRRRQVTLIGRLLYDSKTIFEDQLEAVERTTPRAGRRVHEPGAAHRRPARRARAGHHHRRRLPLLRHPQAQVHHRRHPRPHPVHPQHGHRRLHRRPRADPRRRPQGHRRAVPAPRLHRRRCCGIPHLVLCVNKMDLVDYDEERFDEIVEEFREFATKLDIPTSPSSRSRRSRRQRRRPLENMPWYEGRRCCTTSRRSTSPATAT
jgi:bifunctional enzyme CysN/CysC